MYNIIVGKFFLPIKLGFGIFQLKLITNCRWKGKNFMDADFIQKVGQIGVPVKDLERAIHFYKDQLNLPLLFNTDTMAFFECNGLRLLLSLPEKDEFANASSVIYFQVDQIKNTYEKFLRDGVTFIDEPHLVAKMGQAETWMTFFKDTEGNTHALMSEVHAQ